MVSYLLKQITGILSTKADYSTYLLTSPPQVERATRDSLALVTTPLKWHRLFCDSGTAWLLRTLLEQQNNNTLTLVEHENKQQMNRRLCAIKQRTH